MTRLSPSLIGPSFIGLLSLFWPQFSCLAEDNFGSVRELMVRVIAEREKLIQYSVDVKVHGELPKVIEVLGVPQSAQSKTLLQLEYSRHSSHYVVLACPEPSASAKVWDIFGNIGGFAFRGRSNENIKFVEFAPIKVQPETELMFFDPRAVGLLDWEQYSRGGRYERSASALTHFGEDSRVSFQDGKWVAQWPEQGLRIAFDPQRAYWPTSMDLEPKGGQLEQHWRVTLGTHLGIHAPRSAEFKLVKTNERGRELESQVVHFDFEWNFINETFRWGYEANMKRLGEFFDIPVELKPKKTR